ncbi:MAG: carboxymuconolactone decarboxylase family protein [Alphaproteobacteria bacterium]|nr:carboxymuconolactone decarboxylase family protein [Alphaproteobacteria bacterium]
MPKAPRLAPLKPEEWTDEMRALLAPVTRRNGSVFNIFATFVRNPTAFKAFLPWATHVLNHSSLPPREREILILRTGHLSGSDYEWRQHVRIARHVGMNDADIARVKEGAAAGGWTAGERALLALADELHARQKASDATWAELARHFREEQVMDAIFCVGLYTAIAMALNSFGVEVDAGL